MLPDSLCLPMISASLLWVGCFGFTAGSTLKASAGAALAMTNSFVATAAAALSWMFAEWIIKGHPSVLGALSGAVAGVVAGPPAGAHAGPEGAPARGLVGGAGWPFFFSAVQKQRRSPDPRAAVVVHFTAG